MSIDGDEIDALKAKIEELEREVRYRDRVIKHAESQAWGPYDRSAMLERVRTALQYWTHRDDYYDRVHYWLDEKEGNSK